MTFAESVRDRERPRLRACEVHHRARVKSWNPAVNARVLRWRHERGSIHRDGGLTGSSGRSRLSDPGVYQGGEERFRVAEGYKAPPNGRAVDSPYAPSQNEDVTCANVRTKNRRHVYVIENRKRTIYPIAVT